tara:strand:- start:10 stop:969 length:960 start_codon:yes stop_codon:yes gene_type:complete
MDRKNIFEPISGFELPRFAGLPTFMRLPHIGLDNSKISDVDVGIIGAPWDAGTTNRPGPRHGPRQIRDLSTMIRPQHGVTNFRPFEHKNCADLGDVPPNPANLEDTLKRFEDFYSKILSHNILPLTVGGDHLCSLPILRAVASKEPVGLIQFDSHTDLYHSYFNGQLYTHGTPFRRAIEENLLDPKRMVQVGIRGTNYNSEDRDFAKKEGIRIITIEEFFRRGIDDIMSEVRTIVGSKDTYLSYDIDFIDPAFAPGTGTPEVGGPNSFQALEVVRKLSGIKLVGADLMEVSPPFDASGNTAFLAASILFEELCLISQSI